MLRSARSGRRAGFTLMELLVVLAILVLLVAMVAPRILGLQGKADIKAAKTQIGLFEGALESYAVECGSYPTTEQGLQALITAPAMSAGMGMSTGMNTGMGAGMDMGAGAGAGAVPGAGPDLGASPDMGMGAGVSPAPTATAMQPSGPVNSRWDGPYLNADSVPVDPWGMPYGYAYPPTRGAGPKPDIWSFGPDSQDGTEDDIVNWSRAATGAGQMPGQQGMTSEQLGGGLGPDAMLGPPPVDQGMPPMGQGMPPMGQGMPPMGQGMPPMQPAAPPMQPMAPPAQPMAQPTMP